jgi:chemotaxis protein methyltransferase CheR
MDSAAAVLSRRVGLRFDPALRARLAHAFNNAVWASGLTEQEYAQTLESNGQVLQDLLDEITVQETSFFRDPSQFEALATDVLPRLRGPLTVWSAGCANGQEPYSLAMTLIESGRGDSMVIATDVSTRAIARARVGRYQEREMRGLSNARRERFFTRDGGMWQVRPELLDRVSVHHHNLSVDPPPASPGGCQVVFCRNVLIYFERDDVVRVIARIHDLLPPEGFLFLGYSESLWQVTDLFRLGRTGRAFVYQRADSAEATDRRRAERRAPEINPRPPRSEVRGRRSAQRARADASGSQPERRTTQAAPRWSDTAPPARPGVGRGRPADVAAELAAGEAALAAGDSASAISAFRRAAFLDPAEPLGHLSLALALEAGGDAPAAERAYRAARTALDDSTMARVEAALEGYDPTELHRLLDVKLWERR